MKTITEIKAKRSFAAPGEYAYDAEAIVTDESGKEVYVHVNAYDMFRHYTVKEESIWNFMTCDERDDADDAQEELFAGDPDFDEKLMAWDGKESSIDEPKFIESYTRLVDAKKSEYGKVFDVLAKVVTRMESGID